MELRIENVRKKYKTTVALDGFSASFTEGIYGLIGPNGSGKSTLMKIITRNLSPDGGAVKIDGEDAAKMGKRFLSLIGYMPQEASLYPQLTAWDFMYYMAALKGMDKEKADRQIPKLLDEVSLSHAAKKRISQLSGGMRQRLCFAQALLNDPPILLLDEPTAGLDPSQRAAVRSMLGALAADRIIVLATHVISDVEGIAKEIVLISGGKLAGKLPPKELIGRLEGRVFTLVTDDGAVPPGTTVISRTVIDGKVNLRIIADTPPEGAVPASPTLEDACLEALKLTH